jgi:hypothetical protein
MTAVPIRLKRVEAVSVRTDAYFIASSGAEHIARLVQCDPSAERPVMYRAGDGILVVSPTLSSGVFAGTIRLKAISDNTYIPIDSELIPPFLPDEWVALTREKGLIFLPGNRVLSFDRSRPIAPRDWLSAANVRRLAWQPFPERPSLPDRIFRIEHPSTPAAVIEILNDGKPDGAQPLAGAGEEGDSVSEDDRPPRAGIGARVAAGAAMVAAGMLVAMAKLFNAPNLAKKAADLARRAMESVPRISERLLGEQEAALRNVLRQLKSGDIEKALRKAPIAVPDPDRPGRIDTTSRLSDRDTRFSLRDLISGGSGGSSTWLGGGDVWYQLANEYRRLAAEAIRKGDYRRAAYLYGVLLRDLHGAAAALEQGGFDREAAILYRDRIHDAKKAAAAFERAGESDEAIRLYESINQFELAGDIARRIGEDARADSLFHRAAETYAAHGRYLAAGDLVRKKIGSSTLEKDYYQTGWERDLSESIECGMRIMGDYLAEQDWVAANHFLDHAEDRFSRPRTKDAAIFFNSLRRSADSFAPEPFCDDLDDRIRIFFAKHLRESPSQSQWPLELFGSAGNWPAPVGRDAIAATTKSVESQTDKLPHPFPIINGDVKHVAVSQSTRDIIIATNQKIIAWSPDSLSTRIVTTSLTTPVMGLSVTDAAEFIIALSESAQGLALSSHRIAGNDHYHRMGVSSIDAEEWTTLFLPPAIRGSTPDLLAVCIDGKRHLFRGSHLFRLPVGESTDRIGTDLVVDVSPSYVWEWSAGEIVRYDVTDEFGDRYFGRPGWRPYITESNFRKLDWMVAGWDELFLCGIDREGDLYWTACDDRLEKGLKVAVTMSSTGYSAACLMSSDRIAATTTDNRLHWLRPSGKAIRPFAKPIELDTSSPVFALVARPAAQEVIAIFVNGTALRIPVPTK